MIPISRHLQLNLRPEGLKEVLHLPLWHAGRMLPGADGRNFLDMMIQERAILCIPALVHCPKLLIGEGMGGGRVPLHPDRG